MANEEKFRRAGDKTAQQLRDEVETLRARVEELEASQSRGSKLTGGPNTTKQQPAEGNYLDTQQGRVVSFVVVFLVTVLIIRVMRKIF